MFLDSHARNEIRLWWRCGNIGSFQSSRKTGSYLEKRAVRILSGLEVLSQLLFVQKSTGF
jgi:hypothetical protein